jgi:hypothetical protein
MYVCSSATPLCDDHCQSNVSSSPCQPNYVYCGVRNAVWVYDMRNATIALPRCAFPSYRSIEKRMRRLIPFFSGLRPRSHNRFTRCASCLITEKVHFTHMRAPTAPLMRSDTRGLAMCRSQRSLGRILRRRVLL